MSQETITTGKKRTVYAPLSMSGPGSSPVISVELEENEEVHWQWIHYSNGQSVVAGYEIVKKDEADVEPFDPKRAISDWLWGRGEDEKREASAGCLKEPANLPPQFTRIGFNARPE